MPRGETAWAFITNFVLNHKPLAMTENLLSQLVIISPASILTPKFGPTFILANHLQHYTIFCCTLYHVLLWQIDALQALKTFIFSPFRKIVIAWFTSVSPYFEKELDRKMARCDIQMSLDFSMSRTQEVVPFASICHPIMLTFPKRGGSL